MIQNEIFQVYESPYYYTTTTKRNAAYSIISLKECQGFIFNQDLFATPFQQLRSLAIEKTRLLRLKKQQRQQQEKENKKKNKNKNKNNNVCVWGEELTSIKFYTL